MFQHIFYVRIVGQHLNWAVSAAISNHHFYFALRWSLLIEYSLSFHSTWMRKCVSRFFLVFVWKTNAISPSIIQKRFITSEFVLTQAMTFFNPTIRFPIHRVHHCIFVFWSNLLIRMRASFDIFRPSSNSNWNQVMIPFETHAIWKKTVNNIETRRFDRSKRFWLAQTDGLSRNVYFLDIVNGNITYDVPQRSKILEKKNCDSNISFGRGKSGPFYCYCVVQQSWAPLFTPNQEAVGTFNFEMVKLSETHSHNALSHTVPSTHG